MVVVSPSLSEPVEGIIVQYPSTKLFVNDQEIGTATLYITEHHVAWGGGVGNHGVPPPSIFLTYPNISLHAIQREPSPALYMVLDHELTLPEPIAQSGVESHHLDDDFDVDEQPITQLRFIPQDEGDLQQMYSAISQGQSLHPDPTDEVDDDPYLDGEDFNEGEEEFEDAEESEEAPTERLRQLRLENSNGVHYQDCEDADIGEE